jgi:hypothetical protein
VAEGVFRDTGLEKALPAPALEPRMSGLELCNSVTLFSVVLSRSLLPRLHGPKLRNPIFFRKKKIYTYIQQSAILGFARGRSLDLFSLRNKSYCWRG